MPSLKVICKQSLSLGLENNFEVLLEYGDELNKMARHSLKANTVHGSNCSSNTQQYIWLNHHRHHLQWQGLFICFATSRQDYTLLSLARRSSNVEHEPRTGERVRAASAGAPVRWIRTLYPPPFFNLQSCSPPYRSRTTSFYNVNGAV